MGDPRATDNAWVESEVYWLHDSEGVFSDIPLVSFQDIPDRKYLFSQCNACNAVHLYSLPLAPPSNHSFGSCLGCCTPSFEAWISARRAY
jgi:hypothetical protein